MDRLLQSLKEADAQKTDLQQQMVMVERRLNDGTEKSQVRTLSYSVLYYIAMYYLRNSSIIGGSFSFGRNVKEAESCFG